jgi:hypothetical protein
MCRSRNVINSLLLLGVLTIAVEQPAAAYTDPGTGALIWQMVAAGFVGGLFYFRKLTTLFTRFKRTKESKE